MGRENPQSRHESDRASAMALTMVIGWQSNMAGSNDLHGLMRLLAGKENSTLELELMDKACSN